MSQGEPETVLADLELSLGLTIQWTVARTLGVGVGIGVFSAIYQAVTGSPVSYNLAPAGIGWWTEPAVQLVILFCEVNNLVDQSLKT